MPSPLPAGMTGSDTSDPRFKLSPGMYDAGEAAMGLKHLALLKKPAAFELGATDPNDPKVDKALTTILGVGDPSTYVAAAAGLVAVSVVASYVPARRAARLDPVTALRR